MAQTLKKHEPQTLTMQRRLAAAPERVFTALTDPADLARWFGPGDVTLRGVHVDLRSGGHYGLEMHYPDGTRYTLSGQYLEVEPPRRLVMTWIWGEGDHAGVETLVTIELAPSGAGTELSLTHENLLGVEGREAHEHGWGGSFDKLEQLVAG